MHGYFPKPVFISELLRKCEKDKKNMGQISTTHIFWYHFLKIRRVICENNIMFGKRKIFLKVLKENITNLIQYIFIEFVLIKQECFLNTCFH